MGQAWTMACFTKCAFRITIWLAASSDNPDLFETDAVSESASVSNHETIRVTTNALWRLDQFYALNAHFHQRELVQSGLAVTNQEVTKRERN